MYPQPFLPASFLAFITIISALTLPSPQLPELAPSQLPTCSAFDKSTAAANVTSIPLNDAFTIRVVLLDHPPWSDTIKRDAIRMLDRWASALHQHAQSILPVDPAAIQSRGSPPFVGFMTAVRQRPIGPTRTITYGDASLVADGLARSIERDGSPGSDFAFEVHDSVLGQIIVGKLERCVGADGDGDVGGGEMRVDVG